MQSFRILLGGSVSADHTWIFLWFTWSLKFWDDLHCSAIQSVQFVLIVSSQWVTVNKLMLGVWIVHTNVCDHMLNLIHIMVTLNFEYQTSVWSYYGVYLTAKIRKVCEVQKTNVISSHLPLPHVTRRTPTTANSKYCWDIVLLYVCEFCFIQTLLIGNTKKSGLSTSKTCFKHFTVTFHEY